MKPRTQIWVVVLLMLVIGTPALAQVNKVIADAKGIT